MKPKSVEETFVVLGSSDSEEEEDVQLKLLPVIMPEEEIIMGKVIQVTGEEVQEEKEKDGHHGQPQLFNVIDDKILDPMTIMEENEVKDDKNGEEEEEDEPNFRQDLPSILLLFFLYVLQGIPLGLMGTIPLMLQSRNVPYTEQAKFSIVGWPFSFKVLYAPIVDTFYFKRIGRRKSWLIPLQYLIAIFLFILSFQIDELMDNVNVEAITAVFFILCLLAASQDITVDGWAISMLHPKNVGYASSCNAVGQTLGSIISYSGFLALNSAEFANNYFRSESNASDQGLVSLPQFLLFWGIVFTITTTLILIFKKESKETESVAKQKGNILASYKNLLKILKLRNMQILILFFFTVRIGYAATEAMTRLKLVEKGVPKERVAFYSIPLIPVKLLIPFVLSKYIAGPKPMSVFIKALPFNLAFGLIMPFVIFWTPLFKSTEEDGNGTFSMTFYILLFIVFALQLIPGYAMFVSSMAFSAKISDPAIGGTYMTLLMTCINLGSMWAHTVALWLVDYVAIPLGNQCLGWKWDLLLKKKTLLSKIVVAGATNFNAGGGILNSTTTELPFFTGEVETGVESSTEILFNTTGRENVMGNYYNYNYSTEQPSSNHELLSSSDPTLLASVNDQSTITNTCSNVIDGFYIESIVCFIIGIIWLVLWGKRTIQKLQREPISTWRIFD